MLLKVKNLTLSYDNVKVLKNVTFNLKKGQVLCVLGESGCGKTSLLKAVRGFMDRDTGEIFFQNERVFNKSEKLVPGTKGIAIVHQDFQLEPGYTVYDNIRHHLIQFQKSYQESKTEEIITLCHLESIRNQTSKELSGGQKQKVALAKAIIEEPPLLLLDEPFSNLDNISKAEFKTILKNIVKKLTISLLFVTHDSRDALTFSDEILIIQNGKLLKKGTPSELIQKPPSKYAAQLLGLLNLFKGEELNDSFNLNCQKNSDYWLPQSILKIKPGNQFTVIDEQLLGNEFEYQLYNRKIKIILKSQVKLTDETYNIKVLNPILIG
ncbi:MAG: spermidine/putrescine ABC transporter ATP-binding protein [Flavobacteriales bacterium]|nr:spermidine/putrescine ABC transporter ATP-binding protein [Flavobacteriales bacterium]|tara:strand:+ start:1605 stop:2573 length:969 start_codon:yes stop_codon:yes gene_type:complete